VVQLGFVHPEREEVSQIQLSYLPDLIKVLYTGFEFYGLLPSILSPLYSEKVFGG